MNAAYDEATRQWYAHVATETVLRVGIGRSERKARESATLARDAWVSPDGRKRLYLGGRRNDTLPAPLVEMCCEFLGVPSLDR